MKQRQPNKKTVSQKSVPVVEKKSAPPPKSKTYVVVTAILLVTFLIYIPSLNNDFQKNWDDQAYVTYNTLIKDVSWSSIVRIFKEDGGAYGNYHPLTTVSLGLNYREGVSSFPFHLTNLFFHLLNTLLVFIFIFLLSDKKLFVAGWVALWFGIHPMHVESVAWISERKDVLYTFFFFLSLIAYFFYVRKNLALKFLLAAFLFFACSTLSKAMAVSLPLVLLLIDYWLGRKFNARTWFEKTPFFLLAILIGWKAIQAQAVAGAVQSITFPLLSRVLHASYAFVMYIAKMFAPFNLPAIYPYPYPLINSGWVTDKLPAYFFLTFILAIAIVAMVIYSLLKKKNYAKLFCFGIGFYAATIALVLQFFPIGRAVMSDRYSYIPFVGLFFIVATITHDFFSSEKKSKQLFGKMMIAGAGILSAIFAILTVKQIQVWKNDETLWTNEIKMYPNDNRASPCYYNRGTFYFQTEKYDKALSDYLIVSAFNPNDDNTYERIGRVYGEKKGDLPNSIFYLEKAFQINPKNVGAASGLATAYGIQGNFSKSLDYVLKAIELAPEEVPYYRSAAGSYMNLGNAEKANEYNRIADELEKKKK